MASNCLVSDELRVSLNESLCFLWENFDDIQREHRGTYIAIHDGKLIAVEESYLDACEAIQRLNIPCGEVLLWHVPTARIA